jgi:hypothetical protein
LNFTYNVTFNLLAFLNYYKYYPIGQLAHITCTYSHLLDESDANKCNSFLRTLVGAEIAKGYYPAITISLFTSKGRANTRAQLVATSSTYLT